MRGFVRAIVLPVGGDVDSVGAGEGFGGGVWGDASEFGTDECASIADEGRHIVEGLTEYAASVGVRNPAAHVKATPYIINICIINAVSDIGGCKILEGCLK